MTRKCGFCRHDADITEDTDKTRRYLCPACGATEHIAKSQSAGWWYFGWRHPDGRKLRAPTSEEMMFQGKFGWQPDNEVEV